MTFKLTLLTLLFASIACYQTQYQYTPGPSISEQFAKSAFVFEGQFLKISQDPDQPRGYAIKEIQITHYYKGCGPQIVNVRGYNFYSDPQVGHRGEKVIVFGCGMIEEDPKIANELPCDGCEKMQKNENTVRLHNYVPTSGTIEATEANKHQILKSMIGQDVYENCYDFLSFF